MAVGRSKCVIRGVKPNKVMPHDELMGRLKKSLYYGGIGRPKELTKVSSPLAEYASELFSEPHKGHSLHRLNKVTAGSIQASPCSLIMALIYLDRLNSADPGYVRRITPQELFIVSMMVSTKFYCGHDEEVYISDWAKEGNITEERMKELEIDFLCAIDWNIYISNEQFFDKLNSVEKILAQRQGIRRGWLTYTELLNLLPSFTIAKFFLSNIAVMAVSYAASVMTIAGAFFLVSHIPGNALTKGTTTSSPSGITSNESQNGTNGPAELLENRTMIDTSLNSRCGDPNSICPMFDVEEELRKLEDEYNEMDTVPVKYNENPGPLINLNGNYTLKEQDVGYESGVNWQRFKDDDGDGEDIGNGEDRNCSSILFWNILKDGELKILQLPYIWFKFI